MIRGKHLFIAMVVLGIAMGGLSVGYHHWAARRAIAWWGSDDVELINRAPGVAALQLRPAGPAESGKIVAIDGERYFVSQRKDVAVADGIDHVRNGLLDDGNLDWEARFSDKRPWQFGLEFSDGARRLIVVFSIKDQRIGRSDSGEMLGIAPVATGWQEFFAVQFPDGEIKPDDRSIPPTR